MKVINNKTVYSYNEMEAIYGKDDKQVQLIKKHLDGLGRESYSNYSLEAFSRTGCEYSN